MAEPLIITSGVSKKMIDIVLQHLTGDFNSLFFFFCSIEMSLCGSASLVLTYVGFWENESVSNTSDTEVAPSSKQSYIILFYIQNIGTLCFL